jgi:hypothetical protein
VSRRSRLKKEAALVRGRIDGGACLICHRIDCLMCQTQALVRHPAVLPLAFVCGMLVGRLRAPDIRCVCGILATLTSQLNAMRAASSLMAPSQGR